MSDEDRALILKGLSLAEYETLKEKAKRNEMVVHCKKDGTIYEEPAREVFARLYNEPVPTY